jgi:hypothetical protein
MNDQDKLTGLWQDLQHEAESVDFTDSFLEYCSQLLLMARNEPSSRPVIAEYIAGTMFMDAVDHDPKIESVALLAGELEVPEGQFDGNYETSWAELVSAIKELSGSRHRPQSSEVVEGEDHEAH